MAYTSEQRKVARTLYRVGRKKGMHDKEILSALMTGLVESGLRNLNYGDRDSVGWRQERSHYGSVGRRRNVAGGADRYYNEIKQQGGWRKFKSAGQMSQAVQRSAFPGRYDAHRKQARDLLMWLKRTEGGGGGAPRQGSQVEKSTKTIPGVDNSLQRKELQLGYLENRNDPNALLQLAQGLKGAQDVPGSTITSLVRTPAPKREQGGGSMRYGRGEAHIRAPRQVRRMLHMADQWDKANVPYLWGGGHGSRAKVGSRVDCSGFVSSLLGISPRTSGGLKSWGRPGKGRHATVWTNDGHVIIQIGHRFYGTSKQNPGGGPGRIKVTRGYLSSFIPRHAPGM